MVPRHWLLVASIVLLFPPVGFGDWITLKTGGRVQGNIVRENDREITMRRKDGSLLSFQRRQIIELHRDVERREKKQTKERVDKIRGDSNDDVVYRKPIIDRRVKHRLGEVVVLLPPAFRLHQEPRPLGDDGREMLGLYREARSGAFLSATSGSFPLGARSFDDLAARLKQHLIKDRGLIARDWERRTVGDMPALYAELENPADARADIVIFTWIAVGPDRVLTLNLTLPRLEFKETPGTYRAISASLHVASEEPESEAAEPSQEKAE